MNGAVFRAPGSQPERVVKPPEPRITSMKQAATPINRKTDPKTNTRELVANYQGNRADTPQHSQYLSAGYHQKRGPMQKGLLRDDAPTGR